MKFERLCEIILHLFWPVNCPVCGKPVPAPDPSDPAKCCSAECRRQLKTMKPAEPAPVKVVEEPKPVEPKSVEHKFGFMVSHKN